MPKPVNLRKLANGMPCQVRIPFVCNFDESTTILAHLRHGGIAGVGMKPPDICGTWSCSDCHRVIDKVVPAPLIDIAECERDGLLRTLNELWSMGYRMGKV